MIYSNEQTLKNLILKVNIYFPRLKLVKTEYIDWKKKIDDGLKQINLIEDEQIIQHYKPFYEVRTKTTRFVFYFIMLLFIFPIAIKSKIK
jgi:hypothetical protein